MSAFEDWYESDWTTKRATVVNTNGEAIETWANNLTGLKALFYQASALESAEFLRRDMVVDGFVELDAVVAGDVLDITEKDRFFSPRGELFSVVSTENPHNLNDFLKFAVKREAVERSSE